MTEHQPVKTAEQLNTEIQLYDKATITRTGMFLIAVAMAAAAMSVDKTVGSEIIKQIAGLGYYLLATPAGAASAGSAVLKMLYAQRVAQEARLAGYQVNGRLIRSISLPN